MKKKKVQKLIAAAEQKVHKYYQDLGVHIATTVHKLDLPTTPLVEGYAPQSTALKITQHAYIDESCVKVPLNG